MKCDLIEINRNPNGDYYFIYSIPKVVNHIKPGTQSRDEVLIVGVPKNKLINFLKSEFPGSEFFVVSRDEYEGNKL